MDQPHAPASPLDNEIIKFLTTKGTTGCSLGTMCVLMKRSSSAEVNERLNALAARGLVRCTGGVRNAGRWLITAAQMPPLAAGAPPLPHTPGAPDDKNAFLAPAPRPARGIRRGGSGNGNGDGDGNGKGNGNPQAGDSGRVITNYNAFRRSLGRGKTSTQCSAEWASYKQMHAAHPAFAKAAASSSAPAALDMSTAGATPHPAGLGKRNRGSFMRARSQSQSHESESESEDEEAASASSEEEEEEDEEAAVQEPSEGSEKMVCYSQDSCLSQTASKCSVVREPVRQSKRQRR